MKRKQTLSSAKEEIKPLVSLRLVPAGLIFFDALTN